MEEFLDAVTEGAVWGTGFAVAVAVGRKMGDVWRPVARGAMRSVVGAGEWVKSTSAESRETLQDLYHQAKAEREAQAAPQSTG